MPATPTSPAEREPVLDLLRGVAVLGILLVNVEIMRGSDVYRALAGMAVPAEGADRTVQALVGWLATGVFVSSFSLLFGVGAGFLLARARRQGTSARALLTRRYLALAVLGVGHALLLFGGDILAVYAATGLVLLTLVHRPVRALLAWSVGLLAGLAVLAAVATAAGSTTAEADATALAGPALAQAELAQQAYLEGGAGAVLRARVGEAALLQSGQLLLLPWFLGLFLLGLAAHQAGWVADLAGHRRQLRRLAAVCVPLGLLGKLPGGAAGTLGAAMGGGPADTGPLGAAAGVVSQLLAAPTLAVGALSGTALLALRAGSWPPLVAVGRVALSAYLAQSALAALVFVGASRYDAWGSTQALGFVVGTWAVLLAGATWWTRRFRFGPVEWVWRAATYGHLPRLRV